MPTTSTPFPCSTRRWDCAFLFADVTRYYTAVVVGSETPAKSAETRAGRASPPVPAPELDAPETPPRGGNGPLCLAAVTRFNGCLLSLERKIQRLLRPGAAASVCMCKNLTILPELLEQTVGRAMQESRLAFASRPARARNLGALQQCRACIRTYSISARKDIPELVGAGLRSRGIGCGWPGQATTSIELWSPDDSCANQQAEQAPFGCVSAAVLGRPMNLTGRHRPGVRCPGGHISSINRRAHYRDTSSASRYGLLHCATRPDSVRGRSLCRRDVWRLAHMCFC